MGNTFVVCSDCREPLVGTLERPGKEWVCVTCGRFTAFFDGGHDRVPLTPELEARWEELRIRYRAEREARRVAADAEGAGR